MWGWLAGGGRDPVRGEGKRCVGKGGTDAAALKLAAACARAAACRCRANPPHVERWRLAPAAGGARRRPVRGKRGG